MYNTLITVLQFISKASTL